MSHEEVRTRLEASIKNMKTITDKFLSAIIVSVEKIPYVAPNITVWITFFSLFVFSVSTPGLCHSICVFYFRYGMRFISKVLKDTLHEKFPDATEDELLKVCICHLQA